MITGHGVLQDKSEELRRAGLRLFDLTIEEKLRVPCPSTDQNRGCIAFSEYTLVRMAGKDSPPHYKEVLAIGPECVPDPYSSGPDSYPSFAPNLWPTAQEDLKPKLLEYCGELEVLMFKIGRAIALGLDMPENSL